MTETEFISELGKIGLNIDENQIDKLNEYKVMLQEWNEKINLTTLISDNDIYLKHFYDSLVILTKVSLNGLICDFGTGAGFPGIVLAIMLEKCSFDLLESNLKKCKFLEEVINKLELKNVKIINERMEEYSRKNTEKYDYIVCRAVSNLGIICELAVRPLKIEGCFIPFKTKSEKEYSAYKNNILNLGYKLLEIKNYKLPIENSDRSLLIFRKEKSTLDKYPRNYNIIKKENRNLTE